MKAFETELRAFEKRYLLKLAKKFDWHVTHMVEFSGIGRTQLYRMCRRNDITIPEYDKINRTRDEISNAATRPH